MHLFLRSLLLFQYLAFMSPIIQKLRSELESVLDYWKQNVVISEDVIYGEVSCDNIPNIEAELGSMYLARIIYGASAGCKRLNTEKYKFMAEACFRKLQKELKNPAGGYYWAINRKGEPLHDVDNINMAQAFILYGLAEYYSLTSSDEVKKAIHVQVEFLLNTIYDKKNGGFFDGFNMIWEIDADKTRFFGTHLHLLEAFTKLYQCDSDFIEKKYIEELLDIILNYFIEKGSNKRIHQLKYNWQAMNNTVWAGHDAECSWILCQSAKAINHTELIATTEKSALIVMDAISEQAIDNVLGGAFNEMEYNIPVENQKMWWPQAEMTLAFLNCFQIEQQEKYLNLALKQIDYITTTFISPNGEWYTAVSADGIPDLATPKVNFWKSLYHNVRYYVDSISRLEEIN